MNDIGWPQPHCHRGLVTPITHPCRGMGHDDRGLTLRGLRLVWERHR